VAVAVDADLMAGVGHRLHLAPEGLDRVPGDEPCGLDAEPLEQFQKTRRADFAGKQAP